MNKNSILEMFKCEHLDFGVFTKKQIKRFSVKYPSAQNLETFIKKTSKKEEMTKSNRVYLVKDSKSNEVAGYFSLRNGLFTLEAGRGAFSSVPAVELSNFAINQNYLNDHPECKKLGELFFHRFILPLVKQVQDISGTQALYIYSLPYDKLMAHYGTLGFLRLDPDEEQFVHQHVKPMYDEGCIFMWQRV